MNYLNCTLVRILVPALFCLGYACEEFQTSLKALVFGGGEVMPDGAQQDAGHPASGAGQVRWKVVIGVGLPKFVRNQSPSGCGVRRGCVGGRGWT